MVRIKNGVLVASGSAVDDANYAFDNDISEAENQLRYLGEILDPHTVEVLTGTGVTTGWSCWDIGSGAGTIANWLADRVGSGGRVLATDIKPQHISGQDNLQIVRHDLRADPLPVGGFDLIHARLLLMHLPDREQLVRRLASALNPGGVLVVSDWETSRLDLVLDSPDEHSAGLFVRFLEVLLAGSPLVGIDPHWAARAHQVMRAAGLVDVATVTSARSWAGGTAGCLLHRSNSIQLHARLLDLGFTNEELNALREVLVDPRFVASSYLMLTTTGKRPN
jgi:SAM-dependent methyltransferase